MFCAQCGTKIEEGAAFCSSCGAKVGENSATPNIHLEKAKVISKGYFSFFLDHIKAPIRQGFAVDRASWLNGLITLIIFSLFMSFTSFILASSISRGFNSIFGSYMPGASFWDHFLLPFIYMVLFFAVMIGVTFLVAKMMKSDANFQDVTARFGTFMIIPTVFALLTFLFGVLRAYILVGLFSMGYLLSMVCAVVLTVYSYGKDQRGGLDAYYGILLAFLGLAIALMLFGSSFSSGISNIF